MVSVAPNEVGVVMGGRKRRRWALEGLGALWILVVTILFLWQAATYCGVVAWLAEWQFDWIGRYYPAQTCFLLILLCSAPGLLMVGEATRRWTDLDRPMSAPRYSRLIRVLLVVAIGCMVTTVGVLALAVRLPSATGPERVIHTEAPVVGTLPDGPAVLIGSIDYLRTAALEEDVFLSRRNTLFAPIGQSGVLDARFFVEIDRDRGGNTPPSVETRHGILRRAALPGEVLRLYRSAGLSVPATYYVLYADRKTLVWPYLAVAGQMTLVAAVLALSALVLLGLRRRFDRARVRMAAAPEQSSVKD